MKTKLLILCILLHLKGVAQLEQCFNTPFPKQFGLLDSLVDAIAKQDSATAWTTLNALEKAAKQNGEEAALLNYRRSVLRYRYIQTFNSNNTRVHQKLIEDSENLLREIDENEFPEIAALVHVNIGNSLNYKDINYDLAFDHYLKAYQLFKSLPKNRSKSRHYDLYSIALAYYQFGDFANAITLGNEINVLFPEPNVYQVFNRGMLAMAYLELKKYPELLEHASWILINQKKIGMEPIWGAIGSENYGYGSFYLGRFAAAEMHLKNAIAIRRQENKQGNFIELYALLSSVYSKTNQPEMAEQYLDSSRFYGKNVKEIQHRIQYYEAAIDFFRPKGDFSKLSLFQDSLLKGREVIAELNQTDLVHRSEMRVERDKKLKQEEEFRDHKIQSTWIRNGILGLFLVLLVIAGLVFRDFRNRVQHEKVLLTQKNEAMETELLLAREQLSEYVRMVIEKNQQIQLAENKLKKMKTAEIKQVDQAIKNTAEIDKFIQSESIITKEDWDKFSAMFTRAYPQFLEQLESRYPNLTKAEMRYLVLLKLEIPQKDMALILGVGNDAIRQVISRIKRKLNLDSREDFAKLLSE